MSKILYAASTMSHINNFHTAYIDALRRDGHEVKVMARGDGADFDIPFVKKMLSHKNTSCRREIRRIIEREKFDAVVLNTALAAFHIRLAMPKKNRPKVVNISHGYLFGEKTSSLKEKILLACEKYLAPRTDSVIVMNDEDMRIARDNRLSKNPPLMILGMGATTPPSVSTREEIRRELLSEDAYVMTFVGELSDRKNQRLLISALPELKLHIPSAVLWLVGDGDKKGELIELADKLGMHDSVVFTGKRSNPCDFIRAADLYVSASKIEGMPFNLIEALGAGATILCSDIKGHRDLIEDGKTGFLFKSEDVRDFVLQAAEKFDTGATPDASAVNSVYEKYSFDNVFEKTYSVIREALNI